ncbi:hypothetical protein [Streptomyces tauricus]|uniref:hypothetical protein n=1 Tax=Streptomyces tauricus TaxID=68274 RepID=UPI0034312A1F
MDDAQPPSSPDPQNGNWYSRQSVTVKAALIGSLGVVAAALLTLIPLLGSSDDPATKEGDNNVKDSTCVFKGDHNICGLEEEGERSDEKIAKDKALFRAKIKPDYTFADSGVFSWALDRKLSGAEENELQQIGGHRPRAYDRQKELEAFMKRIGARPFLDRKTEFTMDLFGITQDKVTITDLKAHVDRASCKESKIATFIRRETGGSSGVTSIGFNLDDEVAGAWIREEGKADKRYSRAQRETLSFDDTGSSFFVSAAGGVRGKVCEWSISAEYSTNLAPDGKQEINDAGKPFMIEAIDSSKVSYWVENLDYGNPYIPGPKKPFVLVK